MSLHNLLGSVQSLLDEHGISANVRIPDLVDGDIPGSMICITGDLSTSRTEMKRQSRDNVVMVRVDDASLDGLDSWIKSGVVSSRSEAAALFIKEGLSLRNQELGDLQASIDKVERAQEELRQKARTILGDDPTAESDE